MYSGRIAWIGKSKISSKSVSRCEADTPFACSLDRTNVVEDILSQTTLESFIESWASGTPGLEAFSSPSHPIWTHHRVLWADNGDALSKIYAGTGALNTSFTRSGGKKTLGGSLGGLVSDAAKSMGR